ncbi:MAG: hypothetical protein CMH61_00420 [Nanoarchaeota archaeon]|nr:hypothetical protein [Nanoarchaeota archaeon]
MVDVTLVLLSVSFILFFGFLAEFLFKKTGIPDVLLLLILGFVLGPSVANYVPLDIINPFIPIFTTFALLFLLYQGAFNIDLASFAKEIGPSLVIMIFNFGISTIIITAVMMLFGQSFLISLLLGVILGGVSSSFVVPVLQGLNVRQDTYSVLTLESAFTDVLTIVSALTVMEIMRAGSVGFQAISNSIVSLFAIAGLIGIVGGIVWILLVQKVFKENTHYMITVAYLLMLYVFTEFLQGNGAIAALFFGLILKNGKQLVLIMRGIVNRTIVPSKSKAKAKIRRKMAKASETADITTKSEELFYEQISFFLKTFFFVYIGLLFNINVISALIIGGIISVLLLISRNFSSVILKGFTDFDRTIVKSMFARGIAAAAIIQIAIQQGIADAVMLADIVYAVIIFTVVLSSVRIFIAKLGEPEEKGDKA